MFLDKTLSNTKAIPLANLQLMTKILQCYLSDRCVKATLSYLKFQFCCLFFPFSFLGSTDHKEYTSMH